MRRATLMITVLAALFASVALVLIGQDMMSTSAIAWQRDAQNALAGALRALRAGQPGATLSFLTLCFGHGFLHALGPGHGKAVIAAFGAASAASLRNLLGLAAVSSMAQAAVAVGIVYAGVWILDGARDRVEGLGRMIEPLSFGLISILGVLLCWRGLRHLITANRNAKNQNHPHPPHEHTAQCDCGHSHMPSLTEMPTTWNGWEAAALVAGIALRPCTSALFLLILTWRLDLVVIGIVGTFVMGLGTMMVTASAALFATLARRGIFIALPRGGGLIWGMGLFELGFGLAIALFAGSAMLRLL